MTTTALTPVVSVQDGTVFANSKDVADFFGKRHDHVMTDIRYRMESLSPEISGQWFQPTTHQSEVRFGTRHDPAFNMTRDGFTFLVMKWQGKKATEFQVKYIQRFNEMEEELRSQAPAVPQSFAEALQLAADQAVKIEQQDQLLTAQAPKVEHYDNFADTDGTMTISHWKVKYRAANVKFITTNDNTALTL